jgi:D-proline reductase (dithiol) PrdB
VCHQTVSLVARYLEERGLPTLCMASALDIIQAGNPPRSVFVDYPLGHTAGKPFDSVDQRRIVRAALRAFASIQEPGNIVHLDGRWSDDDAWKASAAEPSAGDQRSPRNTEPQYQTEEDRALAEAGRGA